MNKAELNSVTKKRKACFILAFHHDSFSIKLPGLVPGKRMKFGQPIHLPLVLATFGRFPFFFFLAWMSGLCSKPYKTSFLTTITILPSWYLLVWWQCAISTHFYLKYTFLKAIFLYALSIRSWSSIICIVLWAWFS